MNSPYLETLTLSQRRTDSTGRKSVSCSLGLGLGSGTYLFGEVDIKSCFLRSSPFFGPTIHHILKALEFQVAYSCLLCVVSEYVSVVSSS